MADTSEGVLRGRLPWWPLWGAGGVALLGALARDVAIPAAPMHLWEGGALAAACAGAAVTLGAVAGRRHPMGPYTTLGRRASFPWTQLRIGQNERLRHVHCLGPTGSGKTSSILAPMLVQDLTSGAGITVIEIQGSELGSTARAWAERLGRRVISWEPGHPESGCWNPLRDRSAVAAERLIQALRRAAGEKSTGDYYEAVGGNILRHAVAAFAAANEPLDLCRLRAFLTEPPFRHSVMARVGDPAVLAYFRSVFDAWNPEEQARNLQGVRGHLDALLAPPFVRRALCPPAGAVEVDLGRCLRDGAVLLVRLPLSDMLRLAEVLGTLLLSGLQAAVSARAAEEPPHFLYLDEFQHFCGPGFGEFLALAGGRGVGLVLAHQNLAQLRHAGGTALEGAVLSHASTTVLLRCDAPDAETLAPWLPPRGRRAWHPHDLSELPFGIGVARVSAGRRPRAHFVRLGYVGGQRR